MCDYCEMGYLCQDHANGRKSNETKMESISNRQIENVADMKAAFDRNFIEINLNVIECKGWHDEFPIKYVTKTILQSFIKNFYMIGTSASVVKATKERSTQTSLACQCLLSLVMIIITRVARRECQKCVWYSSYRSNVPFLEYALNNAIYSPQLWIERAPYNIVTLTKRKINKLVFILL